MPTVGMRQGILRASKYLVLITVSQRMLNLHLNVSIYSIFESNSINLFWLFFPCGQCTHFLSSSCIYPWSVFATRLGSGSDLRKRPEVGRFRKFVEFDQSKGIGGRVWPRRSRFGYWFGRPRRRGGEIDDNGV